MNSDFENVPRFVITSDKVTFTLKYFEFRPEIELWFRWRFPWWPRWRRSWPSRPRRRSWSWSTRRPSNVGPSLRHGTWCKPNPPDLQLKKTLHFYHTGVWSKVEEGPGVIWGEVKETFRVVGKNRKISFLIHENLKIANQHYVKGSFFKKLYKT